MRSIEYLQLLNKLPKVVLADDAKLPDVYLANLEVRVAGVLAGYKSDEIEADINYEIKMAQKDIKGGALMIEDLDTSQMKWYTVKSKKLKLY